MAKFSNIYESAQIIFWSEHFNRFLFEDLTLEFQLQELDALEDRLADAGLDAKFLLEKRLKKITAEMRESGKSHELRVEHWEMFLQQKYSTDQSNISAESVLEFSPPGPGQSQPGTISKDSSAAVARIMDLLHSQKSLPVAHQIEILLRLQSSLRKTRVLLDPLKLLFQLILKKASGIPVYVLLAIAEFYQKLGKFQNALEVYKVASKQVEHLDVPIRFDIQADMAYCYEQLDQDTEALSCYENVYSGCVTIFGKYHGKTTASLVTIVTMYCCLFSNYTKALELCDTICMEQDYVPELDVKTNLQLQGIRSHCYARLGDFDQSARILAHFKMTLGRYKGTLEEIAGPLCDAGMSHRCLDHIEEALEYYHLFYEGYKKYGNLRMTLRVQSWIGEIYGYLGRRNEARDLLEEVLAEQLRVPKPDDLDIRVTRSYLEGIDVDDLYYSGDDDDDGDDGDDDGDDDDDDAEVGC